MLVAQDLLFGPTLRRFPDLKVALSEGGIGWIPFYLDRADRHFQNQAWLDNDFGGKLPSDVFRDHILACYITDPSGLELRDRIGIDIIAWECDYPHTDTTWPESPEFAWKEFQDTGCTDEEIHKITWENSCRFFGWDPFEHTPKEQATVGALRALATDVDTTRMSRRSGASATRPPESASSELTPAVDELTFHDRHDIESSYGGGRRHTPSVPSSSRTAPPSTRAGTTASPGR